MAEHELDEFLLDINQNLSEVNKEIGEPEPSPQIFSPSNSTTSRKSRVDDDIPPRFQIERYANSLNEPLHAHLFAADSMINYINDTKLNYDQQKIFDRYRKKLTGGCENIIQLHDKFFPILSIKNIEKEAEREYYAEFEGNINKDKLNYFKMVMSYQFLKSFNVQAYSIWGGMEKIISEFIDFPEIHSFAQTLMVDKVSPMLLLIEQTDELLLRMTRILEIKNEKIDTYSKDVKIVAQYLEGKNYSIGECFQGSFAEQRRREIVKDLVLHDLRQDAAAEKSEKSTRLTMKTQIDKSKLGSIKNFSLDRVENTLNKENSGADLADLEKSRKEKNHVYLPLVGKKAWNQGKFYQLSYDRLEYERSINFIKSALYFTDRPNSSEESIVRKKVAINLARRNRLNILGDLQNFIFSQIGEAIDDMVDFFEIPVEHKLLFSFHFGAGLMSEMLKRYFIANKLGVCYIVVTEGKNNNIKKEFFPTMIDEGVRVFWESRINIAADDSFDNFWEFSKIADIIRRKYQNELEIHRRKLDTIFSKMGTSRNVLLQKESYWQNHLIDWFGLRNIYAYKRYVERSVFANWNATDVQQRKKASLRFLKNPIAKI